VNNRNFMALLEAKQAEGKCVCVGLDSDYAKIPKSVSDSASTISLAIFNFNERIIAATKDLVCAYKPNFAFYAAWGIEGLEALESTIRYSHAIAPTVPVILDVKDADIGKTNDGYVKMDFDWLLADAITTNPYLGQEAVQPFLDCKDKGVFVLCRTSNKGAKEFQDLLVDIDSVDDREIINARLGRAAAHPIRFYQYVAFRVANYWNKNGNCGVVAGATYPEELARIRRIVGDMQILAPGVGTQGGGVKETLLAGRNSRRQGLIINSSSGVIFASSGPDFAEVARAEVQKIHQPALIEYCKP